MLKKCLFINLFFLYAGGKFIVISINPNKKKDLLNLNCPFDFEYKKNKIMYILNPIMFKNIVKKVGIN